ncbi:hypothetical protein [Nocardia carnea]|uniref:hypothetical protein n=1 Tax=Nocardia carnea TaxID=37328 RepID=UPI002453DB9C|nr:hypothetical protein [Nocardia carnea]
MSGRATRRDYIGDSVAKQSLPDDLAAALAASMHSSDVYLVRAFLSELEADAPRERILRLLETRLSRVRENVDYRDGLAAYLGDGDSVREEAGRCRGCGRELDLAQEPRVGRPRNHCRDINRSNKCRQLAYRNRKREAERMQAKR